MWIDLPLGLITFIKNLSILLKRFMDMCMSVCVYMCMVYIYVSTRMCVKRKER